MLNDLNRMVLICFMILSFSIKIYGSQSWFLCWRHLLPPKAMAAFGYVIELLKMVLVELIEDSCGVCTCDKL